MFAVLKKKDKYIQAFSEHFMCQSLGEDMECVRDNFHQFESDLYAFSVSFILFSSSSCIYFMPYFFLITALVIRNQNTKIKNFYRA